MQGKNGKDNWRLVPGSLPTRWLPQKSIPESPLVSRQPPVRFKGMTCSPTPHFTTFYLPNMCFCFLLICRQY